MRRLRRCPLASGGGSGGTSFLWQGRSVQLSAAGRRPISRGQIAALQQHGSPHEVDIPDSQAGGKERQGGGPGTVPPGDTRWPRPTPKTPRGGWLVLTGPSASGKTHLAAAIANSVLGRGLAVFFVFVPDLLDHLRSAFAPSSDVSFDQLFEQGAQRSVPGAGRLGRA